MAVSRAAFSLGAIFLLALALRLLWVAHTDTQPLWLSDPQYYHATAQNIAQGRGYSVALDDRGFVAGDSSEATAFWPPGYPFALAPLYKLFGAKVAVAKIFNALAGALTVFPIFYVARRLRVRGDRAGSDRMALLAAALFAIMPSLIFWTPSLFSEPLFTLGVATTLAVALWAGDRRSVSAYFFAGVTLAATAFVRSQGLLLLVPVAVLVVHDLNPRHLSRAALPVAAGLALLIMPWAVRNQAAVGRPYLINDNLGYNLRIAHAPYSTGTTVAPQDLWDERPGITFKEREIFFDDAGRRRALTYMREHPGRELRLAAHRIGYLARSDARDSLRWSRGGFAERGRDRALMFIGDAFYYAIISLAAAAVLLVRWSRLTAALFGTIVVWLALHLVFAGEPRYHVPMMPVVSILAAGTLAWCFAEVADRVRPRPAEADERLVTARSS